MAGPRGQAEDAGGERGAAEATPLPSLAAWMLEPLPGKMSTGLQGLVSLPAGERSSPQSDELPQAWPDSEPHPLPPRRVGGSYCSPGNKGQRPLGQAGTGRIGSQETLGIRGGGFFNIKHSNKKLIINTFATLTEKKTD